MPMESMQMCQNTSHSEHSPAPYGICICPAAPYCWFPQKACPVPPPEGLLVVVVL